MSAESTCWTVILGAANGSQADRDEFARRYASVVRGYLSARWPSLRRKDLLEDAVQDVFIECFREGGVLVRAEPLRPGGFRPFLFGVVRNVARRIESNRADDRRRQAPSPMTPDLESIPVDDDTLSQIFDRAWASSIVSQATGLHAKRAQTLDAAAARRVELLRLRFFDGLPIREIAVRWNADPAKVHREYARARVEFRSALREVIMFDYPSPQENLEQRCDELLAILGRG